MDDVMKMDKNHVWSTIAPTLLSYCSAIKNSAYRRIKEFYKYCLVGEEGATSIRVKKVLTVSARFPEWHALARCSQQQHKHLFSSLQFLNLETSRPFVK